MLNIPVPPEEGMPQRLLRSRALSLALGSALLYFSFLNHAYPPAAPIALLLLLRFARGQGRALGLALGFPLVLAAYLAAWYPIMRMLPPVLMLFLIAGQAALFYAALLVDRFAARRLRGLASTLPFPLFLAVSEYLRSFIPSSASYGSLAYSQYGFLPLMQVASVAGIWGITFLLAWPAPVLELAWSEFRSGGRRLPASRSSVLACAAVLALALGYGGLRLATPPPAGGTLRVASATKGSAEAEFVSIYRDKRFRSLGEYSAIMDAASAEAAARGAKLLLWQEYMFQIPAGEKEALVSAASALCERDGLYMVLGIVLYAGGGRGGARDRNEALVVAPDGRVVVDYAKHNLVAGLETSRQIPGEGRLEAFRTPYGLWGAAICYDNDFPAYIRQLGAQGIDLLLNPVLDWPELVPFHSRMSVFRAIENGCPMLRAAGSGWSFAADGRGRILASQDERERAGELMVADLPARGGRTIYSRIGDAPAWLGAGALVALLVAALRAPRRRAS
jgi:apolipoprotein N-acyltransferase